MAGLISQLNSLCDDHPALWRCDREPEGFEWIDDRNAEDSLYSFVRQSPEHDDAVLVVANWTPVHGPFGLERPETLTGMLFSTPMCSIWWEWVPQGRRKPRCC